MLLHKFDKEQTNIYCFHVVLLGNKADLQDLRVVDGNEARNVAENLGLKYFETSAATGQNVKEAVEALLDLVIIQTFSVNLGLVV